MAELSALEARDLRKIYRQGDKPVEALKSVSLEIRAGEFMAILGPSGSGKSTLLSLLGLMDEPTSGEIQLFGQRTSQLSEQNRCELRNRQIGFVFQFDSLLPEFTVLENVMMPGRIALKKEDSLARVESRARELMGLLDILGLAERWPYQLSGGERQRAAIARALANRPSLLLADEPTGNLDRVNGELVFNKMKELAETLKVAAVVVTHNEQVAQFAHRCIYLLDGRIEDKN